MDSYGISVSYKKTSRNYKREEGRIKDNDTWELETCRKLCENL